MTAIEMLTKIRFILAEEKKSFYLSATATTTTSASTFTVASGELDNVEGNAIKGSIIVFTSGENAGLQRRVKSWAKSSKLITLDKQVTTLISTGDKFQLFDGGNFSDNGLFSAIDEAQIIIARQIDVDEIPHLLDFKEETAVQSSTDDYASVILPEDTPIIKLISIEINDMTAEEVFTKQQIAHDPYLDYGYMFAGRGVDQVSEDRKAWIRPNENGTVRFNFIRKPRAVSLDRDSELPESVHAEVCRKAAQIALLRAGETTVAVSNAKVGVR